ncbi:MAG: heme ABC exporter ATP-binding protein CcmA [Candidatus Nanopelagicales bacterium]
MGADQLSAFPAPAIPDRRPARSVVGGSQGHGGDGSLVSLTRVAVDIDRSPVLRDLDLNLAAGAVIGIRGANGAGKTTLLQLVATVRRPLSGIARVLGADLRNPPPPEVRRAICLVGHDPGLYPQLSLRENLHFVADIHGRRPETAETALRQVGLARAADRRVDRCSQGMVKRADLARALISRPTLLLLDEPHAGLDVTATALVESILADVRERGGAALVVSHDPVRLLAMVDDVLELRDGGLLRLGGVG